MTIKDKFQVYCLKEMFDSMSNIRRMEAPEGLVAISDGYCVFFFMPEEMKIDVSKIPQIENSAVKSIPDDLTAVSDTMISMKVRGGKVVRKIESNDKSVKSYISKKYADMFQRCSLRTNGGTSLVYAFDGLGNPVGAFMPIRVSASEEF